MKRKRARDATNGRFITLAEARLRPRETIVETVRKPCPKSVVPSINDAQRLELTDDVSSELAAEACSCSV